MSQEIQQPKTKSKNAEKKKKPILSLTTYITDVEGIEHYLHDYVQLSNIVCYRSPRRHHGEESRVVDQVVEEKVEEEDGKILKANIDNDDSSFQQLDFVDESQLYKLFQIDPNVATIQTYFVYGGDAFDKGTGDLIVSKILVDFKKRYPDRVTLILGNRDVNKLTFPELLDANVLQEEERKGLSSVETPSFALGNPSTSYQQYLLDHHLAHGATGKLKWLLDSVMGYPTTFELRRRELQMRRGKKGEKNIVKTETPKIGNVEEATKEEKTKQKEKDEKKNDAIVVDGRNNSEVQVVTDEEVVESYLSSLRPGGDVYEYCHHAQMAHLLHNSILFVHGAIDEDCLGFVPDMHTIAESYYNVETPSRSEEKKKKKGEENVVKAHDDPPGPPSSSLVGHYCYYHEALISSPSRRQDINIQQWVTEINAFGKAAIQEWGRLQLQRSRIGAAATTISPKDPFPRSMGGACLSGYIRPESFAHGIINNRFAPHGALQYLSPQTVKQLLQSGVFRVVAGHMPCGDSPCIVRHNNKNNLSSPSLDVVIADTSYCDFSSTFSHHRFHRGFAQCEVILATVIYFSSLQNDDEGILASSSSSSCQKNEKKKKAENKKLEKAQGRERQRWDTFIHGSFKDGSNYAFSLSDDDVYLGKACEFLDEEEGGKKRVGEKETCLVPSFSPQLPVSPSSAVSTSSPCCPQQPHHGFAIEREKPKWWIKGKRIRKGGIKEDNQVGGGEKTTNDSNNEAEEEVRRAEAKRGTCPNDEDLELFQSMLYQLLDDDHNNVESGGGVKIDPRQTPSKDKPVEEGHEVVHQEQKMKYDEDGDGEKNRDETTEYLCHYTDNGYFDISYRWAKLKEISLCL